MEFLYVLIRLVLAPKFTFKVKEFQMYLKVLDLNLVYKASYAAICKKRDLKDWLKEAQDTKNADMIRQWRKFHLDVLHPLDLAAVRLIKDNSHLYHQAGHKKPFVRTALTKSYREKNIENYTNDSIVNNNSYARVFFI